MTAEQYLAGAGHRVGSPAVLGTLENVSSVRAFLGMHKIRKASSVFLPPARYLHMK